MSRTPDALIQDERYDLPSVRSAYSAANTPSSVASWRPRRSHAARERRECQVHSSRVQDST
eukprot:6642008-Prymnesium_polylepis.1